MRQLVMGLVTLLPMIAMACIQGETTAGPTSQTRISPTEAAIIVLPPNSEPSPTVAGGFLATSAPVLAATPRPIPTSTIPTTAKAPDGVQMWTTQLIARAARGVSP